MDEVEKEYDNGDGDFLKNIQKSLYLRQGIFFALIPAIFWCGGSTVCGQYSAISSSSVIPEQSP